MPASRLIYQFKITLVGTEPSIWRRIQVPETYSFWDLHVAIQDAMGWLDYHLHLFEPTGKVARRKPQIGIPDESGDEFFRAGWEVPITEAFATPGHRMTYEYDFGDSWTHDVLLEGILLGEPKGRYPRCLAGERACPPEDVGGISGYEDLIEVLSEPGTPRYEEMTAWLQGHAKNYHPYNPDAFSPDGVRFDNPKRRWQYAFGRRAAE